MKSVHDLLKEEAMEEEKKREDEDDQDMFLKNMVQKKRDINSSDI